MSKSFSTIPFVYISVAYAEEEKSAEITAQGVVQYVSSDQNFILINLGKNSIKKGEVIEIYRETEPVAAYYVKRALENMSEAAIIDKADNVVIELGDAAIARGLQKDTVKIRKPPPLPEKKPGKIPGLGLPLLEEKEEITDLPQDISATVKEEIEIPVKEIEAKTPNIIKPPDTIPDPIKKEPELPVALSVSDLSRDLETRFTRKVRSLENKIQSLEGDKASLEKGLIELKKAKTESEAALKERIRAFEKSREDSALKQNRGAARKDLERRIVDLTAKNAATEEKLRDEIKSSEKKRSSLKKELRELAGKNDENKLRSQITKLEKAKDELESRFGRKIKFLEKDRASLAEELLYLKKSHDISNERLKDQVESLKSEIASLKEDARSSEGAFKAELTSVKEKTDTAESKLKTELAALRSTKEASDAKLKKLESRLKNALDEL